MYLYTCFYFQTEYLLSSDISIVDKYTNLSQLHSTVFKFSDNALLSCRAMFSCISNHFSIRWHPSPVHNIHFEFFYSSSHFAPDASYRCQLVLWAPNLVVFLFLFLFFVYMQIYLWPNFSRHFDPTCFQITNNTSTRLLVKSFQFNRLLMFPCLGVLMEAGQIKKIHTLSDISV